MSQCYCPTNDGQLSPCGGGQACGKNQPGYYNASSGVQLCCAAGDQCGANSICAYNTSNPHHPPYGSGFYLGGCTDPTFQDPLCRNDCQSRLGLTTEDIVYMPQLDLWSCCGDNASTKSSYSVVNCSFPQLQLSFRTSWSAQEFPGPIGVALAAAPTVTPASSSLLSDTTSRTTKSSITTLSTATSSFGPPVLSTSTPASQVSLSGTSRSSSSSGLSTGTKVGIGVGMSIGGLTMIGLACTLIVLWRKIAGNKRSQAKIEEAPRHSSQESDMMVKYGTPYHEADAMNTRHEVDGTPFSAELENPTVTWELDGNLSVHEETER